jgi:hypothetical protein
VHEDRQFRREGAAFSKEKIMTEEIKKNEGQNPGQQQQKNPQDAAKQPAQDRSKDPNEMQDQHEPGEGGQRRAS